MLLMSRLIMPLDQDLAAKRTRRPSRISRDYLCPCAICRDTNSHRRSSAVHWSLGCQALETVFRRELEVTSVTTPDHPPAPLSRYRAIPKIFKNIKRWTQMTSGWIQVVPKDVTNCAKHHPKSFSKKPLTTSGASPSHPKAFNDPQQM